MGEGSMRRGLGVVTHVAGVIALLLSWWAAALTGLVAGRQIVKVMDADDYRRATFTIERLVYAPGTRNPGRASGPDRIWAEGTVEGRKELYDLAGYVKGPVKGRADLERQFRIGQQLEVLYNPEAPATLMLRVAFFEPNHETRWRSRLDRVLRVAYLPLAVALAISLSCGAAARRLSAGMGYLGGSAFFVLLSWVFVLLDKSG